MSVLAFDGRVVAGDTLVTAGMLELPGSARKFHAFRKGKETVVLGFTGLERAAIPATLWYLSDDKLQYPMSNADEGSLFVLKLGFAASYTTPFPTPIMRTIPYAARSGQDVAHVLMKEYGIAALGAVEVASKYTQGCGGPFEAFDLKRSEWIQRAPALPNFEFLKRQAARFKWSMIE